MEFQTTSLYESSLPDDIVIVLVYSLGV